MLKLLLTCEHGGNEIPPQYMALFQGAEDVLASHKGWDIGALGLYRSLLPLAHAGHAATTSRLLVELNRSLHHPKLFSAYTQTLAKKEKQRILEAFYHPYRQAVERQVREWLDGGSDVIHISMHTFTPVWDGEERNADIGLLYDPSRLAEKLYCQTWRALLLGAGWRTRCNYPYLGKADGLVTSLRKQFPKNYVGIELEANQRWASEGQFDAALAKALHDTLASVFADAASPRSVR